MNFQLLHPADQLIMIMERIYNFGMTTTSGGNLSIKDEDGDVWITPASIDKGSLKREDIVCVHPDGSWEGIHSPSSELPFHMSLYRKREDIRAIVHAHPPALVAFSVIRKVPDINIIPSAHIECGEVRIAEYELPGSEKLGKNIADQFLPGVHTVILENHGVVIGKENLFSAFMAFETLDFCARLNINAMDIGWPRPLTAAQFADYAERTHPKVETFACEGYGSKERGYRRQICDFMHRAYRQELFTSTQGTFSQRLEGNDFIISPYNKDRNYLQPEELVTIRNGRKEEGKFPSRSMLLHKAIYENNPEINSVIIAHPPAIMAFAVTDRTFDARLIPESYIMLKDVQRIPFGQNYKQPEEVAKALSNKNPVAIVENDCVIVTGTSLLNAFDRLEVLEYSAKAVISANKLGPIIKISEEQVDEIEVAFHLK